jgi:lipopolysaccharide export system protein LptC
MIDAGRRTPALLLLILGSLLAAGSFWLLEWTRRDGEPSAAPAPRTEPDYMVDGFRYTKVAHNGRAEYVIEGKRLVHTPGDQLSQVDLPIVYSYKEGQAPTHLRAERAVVNEDHSEVHLYDKVRLDKPEVQGSEALTINSEYLLVLPNQDLIKTDRLVHLTLGRSTLDGVGLLVDNRQKQLTLQSRVNASYLQP